MPGGGKAPTLTCPGGSSSTGAYQLTWSAPGDEVAFRLEEDGALLYAGPQQATSVSGRPAGLYHYQVATVAEGLPVAWSAPCSVQVQPPSLALALGVFGLGLLVFGATLLLVIRGHRAHRRGEHLP